MPFSIVKSKHSLQLRGFYPINHDGQSYIGVHNSSPSEFRGTQSFVTNRQPMDGVVAARAMAAKATKEITSASAMHIAASLLFVTTCAFMVGSMATEGIEEVCIKVVAGGGGK